MNKITTVLLTLFMASLSDACPISPFKRITMDPERFLERSDVMFFGRLDFEEISSAESTLKQVATFTVIKAYKGAPPLQVTVNNILNSSCSRAFQVPNSAYYVFANLTSDDAVYEIDGYASFIPLGNAIEYEWSPE